MSRRPPLQRLPQSKSPAGGSEHPCVFRSHGVAGCPVGAYVPADGMGGLCRETFKPVGLGVLGRVQRKLGTWRSRSPLTGGLILVLGGQPVRRTEYCSRRAQQYRSRFRALFEQINGMPFVYLAPARAGAMPNNRTGGPQWPPPAASSPGSSGFAGFEVVARQLIAAGPHVLDTPGARR
jgi:hypothetical protein